MASIRLSRREAEKGDLPDVCMRCGEPATERKRLRFTSHPVWVYVLVPFGLLPYLIVAAILTERVRCYTLFCDRHRKHWLVRTLIVWGAFVAVLVVIAGSFIILASLEGRLNKSAQETLSGLLCFGSVLLILCWLISIPITQLTAIHPADVTETRLTLKCVSPEFVDAVKEHRERRRAEGQQEDHRRTTRRRRPEPDRGERED